MTYLAQTGGVVNIDGAPAIVLQNGQIHQLEDGSLRILEFDQHTFDLSPFLKEDSELVLKSSDRYLHELFSIDKTNYLEKQNKDRYAAEGHARMTTPLLNIVMAMIAIIAVIGGDFSRRGYGRRITIATGAALVVVILQLIVQAEAVDNPALNWLQWGLPIGIVAGLSIHYFGRGRRLGSRSDPPQFGIGAQSHEAVTT